MGFSFGQSCCHEADRTYQARASNHALATIKKSGVPVHSSFISRSFPVQMLFKRSLHGSIHRVRGRFKYQKKAIYILSTVIIKKGIPYTD